MVELLNPKPGDAPAARSMLAVLDRMVEDAEARLLHHRAASYDEYVEKKATLDALRGARDAAAAEYGRFFRV